MKVLVWQWGRFGAMPRFAMLLSEALRDLPGIEAVLSLSEDAELLKSAEPPRNDLLMKTYQGPISFALRLAGASFAIGDLTKRLRALRPDVAVCVHPGPLDLLMTAALRRERVPFVALLHDAYIHPGDGLPLQMSLQAMVYRRAAAIGVLTEFVGKEILARGMAGTASRPLIRLSHPPIAFPMPAIATRGRGGFHLLMFGRLLTYKGLDLLTGALTHLGPRPGLAVRVVGTGPESTELKSLRALPGVIVENRWVPEDEIGALLAWSDAVILPYREASQSGVAAAALAAGRWVLATRVGGLPEQLSGSPRAVICEPDVTSLATGLHRLMNAPRVDEERSDDHELAWRRMAELLVEQVNHLGLCRSGETPSIVSVKQPHSL